MRVRRYEPQDRREYQRMREDLWPDCSDADNDVWFARDDTATFLATRDDGSLCGFVEVGSRRYAEGCESSPVGYIEGWWVDPDVRRRGAGRALLLAAESWARARGYTEMASDALLDNLVSHTAHGRCGYTEVERLVAFRKSLALVFVALVLGCSDPSGPERPPNAVDVSIDFCFGDAPTWFAYKNEGYEWRQAPVPLFASEGIHFPATPKLAITYYRSPTGLNSGLHIVYLTLEELQAIHCWFPLSIRNNSGTVAGVEQGGTVTISLGGRTALVLSGNSSYQAFGLPNGPIDLAAMTILGGQSPAAKRVILRHAIDPPSGSALPVLDFASAEAANIDSATLTVEGLENSMTGSVSVMFQSERGSSLGTSELEPIASSNRVATLPASLLGALDVHRATASVDSTLKQRRCALGYWHSGDHTVALGPALSVPQIDTISTSPLLRLRMRLPSQPEYDDLAKATFARGGRVLVTMTAGYLGATPTVWELAVPDLSGVPGFDAEWALWPGTNPVDWEADAWSTRAPLYFRSSVVGLDGEALRCAHRQSRSDGGGPLAHRAGF